MKTFGLLGYPLGHSFSKKFFTEKFEREAIIDCRYFNYSFPEIGEAVAYLKSLKDLEGLNVTIPYKEKILPYLKSFSETVAAVQSCNCIRMINGKWLGHNTDVMGFEESLLPLLQPHHRRALIFGTGGASKAVEFVLKKNRIDYSFVSRSPGENSFTYEELNPEIISNHQLLINTTPVGMAPDSNEILPLPYEGISKDHVAYDLIYNPEETMFLKESARNGALTKNGMEMLQLQAEESWKIWNV